MLAEGLSFIDIGNVHFNDRRINSSNRISDGDGGVGVGPGIENDAVVTEAHFVELINNLPFVITLEILEVSFLEHAPQMEQGILKGVFTVDLRLPLPQQI